MGVDYENCTRHAARDGEIMAIVVCFTFTLSGVPGMAEAEAARPLSKTCRRRSHLISMISLRTSRPPSPWAKPYSGTCRSAATASRPAPVVIPTPGPIIGPRTSSTPVLTADTSSAIPACRPFPARPAVTPQFAPNYQVKAGDFPFHSRDPETAGSAKSAPSPGTQEFLAREP